MRLLAVPIGLSGSGPTLWALYPSLDGAEAAAERVREELDRGLLDEPGGGHAVRQRDHHRQRTWEEAGMTRRAVTTSSAPPAAGPYSQAIADGRPRVLRRPARARSRDRRARADGVEAQAEQALRNLQAVLDAAGCTFADVVKTTCFLADINDFAAFNAVYARFMSDPPPARSTFQVAALPKGARVEIEAIAVRSKA